MTCYRYILHLPIQVLYSISGIGDYEFIMEALLANTLTAAVHNIRELYRSDTLWHFSPILNHRTTICAEILSHV
jgi:hypothetical protein